MVLDDLANAGAYLSLGPGIARALVYLQQVCLRQADVGAVSAGRHDIDGARVFALISDYETRPREAGVWEAHRRHIDVQYVHAGEERVGRVHLSALDAGPYNAEKDVLFAEGEGEYFALRPGRFAIFFPHDAHMPGLAVGTPGPVRKIVIKVAIE